MLSRCSSGRRSMLCTEPPTPSSDAADAQDATQKRSSLPGAACHVFVNRKGSPPGWGASPPTPAGCPCATGRPCARSPWTRRTTVRPWAVTGRRIHRSRRTRFRPRLRTAAGRAASLLVAHHLDGMGLTDIAAELEVPVGTGKSRLHRRGPRWNGRWSRNDERRARTAGRRRPGAAAGTPGHRSTPVRRRPRTADRRGDRNASPASGVPGREPGTSVRTQSRWPESRQRLLPYHGDAAREPSQALQATRLGVEEDQVLDAHAGQVGQIDARFHGKDRGAGQRRFGGQPAE